MRATATQYAKSLYEVTKDKSQEEIENVLKTFVKILDKNNQLKLEGDIIKKFGEIYNEEKGIIEVKVISREKIDKDSHGKVCDYVRAKYGAKEIIVNEEIDKGIKGGIIMKIGDEIVDGSIRSRLKKLKNKLAR